MIKADLKDIRRFERDLKAFASKAVAHAQRNTLNALAFETQAEYRRRIAAELTLRNKFTAASVKVEKAGRVMRSVVGSTTDYMDEQEFGGTVNPARGRNKPIATSVAAGQGRGVKPRTKLPTRRNKLSVIKLQRLGGRKPKNARQMVVMAAQQAVKTGNRYMFLDFGRRKGIFKITGGRKSTKRGWPKGARLDMVWDLSHRSVQVPRRPLLGPATDRIAGFRTAIYKDKLLFQLRKNKIFNY